MKSLIDLQASFTLTGILRLTDMLVSSEITMGLGELGKSLPKYIDDLEHLPKSPVQALCNASSIVKYNKINHSVSLSILTQK